MEEKQKPKSSLAISKEKGYKDLTIVLDGIDSKRAKEFNSMKKIEVTKDELLKIGKHRWLLNI
jgi:hypothetical protein